MIGGGGGSWPDSSKNSPYQIRLRGHSKLRKAELITFLQNNLRLTPTPRPIPTPQPAPRPTPALKPYQLRPKRGQETFIEDKISKCLLLLQTQNRSKAGRKSQVS